MYVYLFPLLSGFFLSAIGVKSKKPLILILAILCIFIFLKFDSDPDYWNYVYLYDLAENSISVSALVKYWEYTGIEPGFLLINLIIKSIGLDIKFVYLVFCLISSLVILKITKYFPNKRYLIFIVLYCFSATGIWIQIRFGAACLLTLYAAVLMANKRFALSLVLLIISTTLHSSTIFVLIPVSIYFFAKYSRINMDYLFFMALVIGLIFLFLNPSLIPNILEFVNHRYSEYNEVFLSRESIILKFILFLFLFFLCSRKDVTDSNNGKILFSFFISSIIIWPTALWIGILYRVGVLYDFGLILFLLRDNYRNKVTYFIGVALILVLACVRFISFGLDMGEYRFTSIF